MGPIDCVVGIDSTIESFHRISCRVIIQAAVIAIVLTFFSACPASAATSCVPASSSTTWYNQSISQQTGSFTATYDATPLQADMDGVIGFSLNAASQYSNIATSVRFNDTGTIDALNGSGYAASLSVPYTPGMSYHFRIVINPATHTYSVYVTAPGGSELTLGTNFAFRTQQASTSTLNNWAEYADVGTQTVCNMAITSSSGGTGSTGSNTFLLNANQTALSFGTVTVGSSKSLTIGLTNSGNSTVSISALTTSGAGFGTSGVSTGMYINAGATVSLNVIYAPLTTGNTTGSITISSTATNSPIVISLTGSASQQTSYSVTLNWNPSTSSGVIGYNVYRAGVSGGAYTKLTATPVAGTNYADNSVQAASTYYYVVTAVSSGNVESAFSSQVMATIP